jgi:hypothetical protein
MAPPRSRRRLTSLHECILPLRAQKHIRSALVQRLLPCLPRRPPSLGKLSDCNLTSWLCPSCPIFIRSSPAIPTTSKSRSPDRPNLPIQSSLGSPRYHCHVLTRHPQRPTSLHPYYITTPRYITSAGLHTSCSTSGRHQWCCGSHTLLCRAFLHKLMGQALIEPNDS